MDLRGRGHGAPPSGAAGLWRAVPPRIVCERTWTFAAREFHRHAATCRKRRDSGERRMKAIIAKAVGGANLSADEMGAAMELIFDGDATPSQTAALLVAL